MPASTSPSKACLSCLFIMSSTLENTPNLEEDSEDDLDWEEVEVPEHQHLEITLRARPKPNAVNKCV